jgi:hypothetical protein
VHYVRALRVGINYYDLGFAITHVCK